ncbi:protein BNIP5 [Perognathus longimembris pacificus]|uniref:protein BNIP5 n=1 Tax=Perognathus longimembris pacificus TaxID=214514 RepID=UPI002019CC0D|nr:protein BNIP5 [Perognathus longimembris pacificus]
MENPRGARQSPAARRAGSLDKPQAPRRHSEAVAGQGLSLHATTPGQRALRRVASDGGPCPESFAPPTEAQGPVAEAITKELVPRVPRPPEDAKKDKAQRRNQQGWLKTLLNFLLLRTGSEDAKEKTNRKPKGKEEPTEPTEAAEDPAIRKKAQDKKANRKKHKKHDTEETPRALNQEAKGQEVGVLVEADPGLACRGAQDNDGHQPLPIEGCSAGLLDVSPQAAGPLPEEEPPKPDQDAVLWMIVEVLKKVGDQLEDEPLQIPELELAPQNPAPATRKKPQDKKASLKKAFSLKKPGSEVPKRTGTANPEARPPKRPSFLPVCVGGHRPSSSSSPDAEGPGVQEALCVDGEGPSPSELPCPGRRQGADEEPLLDRAAESREFMQKILALLQDAEELEGEQQPQVLEAELPVENLVPACRKRSQEKKSGLRRAFSHKKHGSKEPKRGGAADATTPEARPPKRPGFLPLCVGGGHRPSISSSSDAEGLEFRATLATEAGPSGVSESPSPQTRGHTPDRGPQPEGTKDPKELLIGKLVVLLQEVDGQLGKQIRRHPSFKRFFHEFSDSSLRKLVASLQSQQGRSSGGDRRLARPSPFAFDLMNQLASHQSRTICSIMGSRGHCSGHSYAQFPAREAQRNITNLESCQSPD